MAESMAALRCDSHGEGRSWLIMPPADAVEADRLGEPCKELGNGLVGKLGLPILALVFGFVPAAPVFCSSAWQAQGLDPRRQPQTAAPTN